MKTHKDLDVWNSSITLIENIYKLTSALPKSELFGITDQIKRASVSIASNIAEGAARQSNKEFIRFLFIALGSCAEVDTQLTIIDRLKLSPLSDLSNLFNDLNRIIQMINGLIRFLKNRDS